MQDFLDEEYFAAKNTTAELFDAITQLKNQLKDVLQIRIDEITSEFLLGFENVSKQELCEPLGQAN